MLMAERDSRSYEGRGTRAEVEEDAVPKPNLIGLASEANQDSAGTGGDAKCREILGALVRERQALRLQAIDAIALEANRLAIEYWRQRTLAEQSKVPSG